MCIWFITNRDISDLTNNLKKNKIAHYKIKVDCVFCLNLTSNNTFPQYTYCYKPYSYLVARCVQI